MSPPAFVVLTLVTLMTLVTLNRAARLHNCPQQGQKTADTVLEFSRPPISVQYTCDRGHAEIYCCVRGNTKLSWSRREPVTWDWEPVQQTSTVYFKRHSRNQTLVIERAKAPRDETRFRCVASDSLGNEIQQEISLEILDCLNLNHAPIARLPVNGTHRRLPGSDFSVTCEGFFGPNYETRIYPSTIIWKKLEWLPNGEFDILETWVAQDEGETGGHVTVSLTKYNQYMESTLTIHGLTKADYANYTCFLKNFIGSDVRNIQLQEGVGKRETTAVHNQLQNNISEDEQKPLDLGEEEDQNSENTNVSHQNGSYQHLRDEDDDDPFETMRLKEAERIPRAVVGGLVALVLIVVIAAAIYWVYRVEIQLYFKEQYGKPMSDKYTYDAFVVYNDASSSDQAFILEKLVPTLEDKHGYRLCLPERDFLAGQYEADNYVHYLSRSQCHLFILSEDTLRHEWADFVFQSDAPRRFHKMVFLRLPGIPEEAWSVQQQDSLRKAIKQSKHVIAWPEVTESDDTRRHSLLKRQDKFWKKLRLALPAKLKKLGKSNSQENVELPLTGPIWIKRPSFVESV